MTAKLARRSPSALTVVPKDIYFNCSRTERKETARALASIHAIRQQAQQAIEALQGYYRDLLELPGLSSQQKAKLLQQFVDERDPLRTLRDSPTPTHLLACSQCGHLTSGCVCLDDGRPRDWGPRRSLFELVSDSRRIVPAPRLMTNRVAQCQ